MNYNHPMHDLVILEAKKGQKGRIISEVSVCAASISKAVKKVRSDLDDNSLLVLQKSALPSLGIFSFETTARLHISA